MFKGTRHSSDHCIQALGKESFNPILDSDANPSHHQNLLTATKLRDFHPKFPCFGRQEITVLLSDRKM